LDDHDQKGKAKTRDDGSIIRSAGAQPCPNLATL